MIIVVFVLTQTGSFLNFDFFVQIFLFRMNGIYADADSEQPESEAF
jgi:hypothetical protein